MLLARTALLVAVRDGGETFKRWIKQLRRWNPKPDIVVFCENNSSDDTLQTIQRCPLPYRLISFYVKADACRENAYRIIAEARDLLLSYARRLRVDYAVFMDYDIFPGSRDWMQRLIQTAEATGAWVVGGRYARGYPEGILLGAIFFPNIRLTAVPKGIYPVYAVAGGLLLLSPQALSSDLTFNPLLPNFAEDYGFCRKVWEAGGSVVLDATFSVKHVLHEYAKPWCIDFLDENENICYFTFTG